LDTQSSNRTAHDVRITTNGSKRKAKVLSTKIPLEDYRAYKIFANEMFDGSMAMMVKTALRRELRANAVNDEKFEILKDAAKTGDLSRIDDAFFILKPRIVKLKRPRRYRIVFE
jgi:hypothetical protein